MRMAARGERSMRGWLVRIFVCLILGAITTVAVAWGSALFVDYTSQPEVAFWESKEASVWGIAVQRTATSTHVEMGPPPFLDIPRSDESAESLALRWSVLWTTRGMTPVVAEE